MTSTVTTVARGDDSRVVEPRRALVRDAAAWGRLWAVHAGPDAPAPQLNFDTTMVAAVFAGTSPSAGYGVEISGTRRDGAVLAVIVRDTRPPDGAAAAAMTATPFHIVSMPRYDGEVRFSTEASSVAATSPPRHARGSGHAPSSTGLSPAFAGALAYLAGPFSGATILMAETSSRFVRFHAWQAIVGLGGLGLLAIGLLGAAFLALFVSPSAFTVLYWISAAAGIAWVVTWIVCVVGAVIGRMWKLPLAGDYALRRAALKQEPVTSSWARRSS